ncbi:alpha/beta fold hydrolase [Arthrobacter sp. Br18]|uniref:alpha/beta fold hydrolase n=1 Tax=Arthrobacter sp. Br18 TaxID=1312954 RepID=UPI0006889BC7|nr:alpha/beta fold hydrolase [Arthrobacter sp. Br18]
MGRHSDHLVEGTDPQLLVALHPAKGGTDQRPVLLLHGFASSSRLNWIDTGWVRYLNDAGRSVITVDLPGHGGSAAPEERDAYSPSRIRADLLQILQDEGVLPLAAGHAASGVDIIGYSLGARLAWEFGGTQPELVHRMVLGGPGMEDPLAAFDLNAAQLFITDGVPITDTSTANLLRMARLVPSNNVFALLTMVEAVKAEPFVAAEAVPKVPLLLVVGDQDEFARSAPELAALAPRAQLEWLPGRTHSNAITSHAFKAAAVSFLGQETQEGTPSIKI